MGQKEIQNVQFGRERAHGGGGGGETDSTAKACVEIREIIEKPDLQEDKGKHPSGQDPTHLNFQLVTGKGLGIVF